MSLNALRSSALLIFRVIGFRLVRMPAAVREEAASGAKE